MRFASMLTCFALSCAAPMLVYAQESCNALLRHGIFDRVRETTEVASNSTIQRAFCSTYNKFLSDKTNGKVEVSYGLFGASGGMSREQIESIGQMMCASDFSDQAAQNLVNKSSALISAPAIDAWRECLRLYSDGLRVETSINDEATILSISVRYVRPAGVTSWPIFDSIQVKPSNAFNCNGSLAEMAKGASLSESSLVMLCERQLLPTNSRNQQGRLVRASEASVAVITGAGAVVRHLSVLPEKPGEIPRGLGEIVASLLSDSKFREINGDGWVLADGRVVPGTAYEQHIAPAVPDLRGMFLRGKNNGRTQGGNPEGDLALGVPQSDEVRSHTHSVIDPKHQHRVAGGYSTRGGTNGPGGGELTNGGYAGGNHYSDERTTEFRWQLTEVWKHAHQISLSTTLSV